MSVMGFAFVIMAQAAGNGLVDPMLASQVTLIVGVSMAMTAPIVILHSQFYSTANCPRVYDDARDVAFTYAPCATCFGDQAMWTY